VYEDLLANVEKLERHYKDMQDIEFTIQEGRLFMLQVFPLVLIQVATPLSRSDRELCRAPAGGGAQCRIGKRSGAAAIKVAVDLCTEGVVSKEEAICMVEPRHLDQLLHPQFADEGNYKGRVLCKGLPASPGAAVGQIVFTPEEAVQFKAKVYSYPFCPGVSFPCRR
jgi:pyruvate,orthophosphate dikinase